MVVSCAVGGGVGEAVSGDRRLYRSCPFDTDGAGCFVLCAKFAFGLQPMRLVVAVPPTGFLPDLMGPPCNAFMADC